jgi:hypothetical protein
VKVISQSIPKQKYLPNEDRWVVKSPVYAVADGAGGTGILCGEWAEQLVTNLPNEPFIDFTAFVAWLEPLAEAFILQHEQTLQADTHQLKRFYQEGSACTLAVLWELPNEVRWLTYGDSLVVYQDTNGAVQSFPYQDPNQFSGGTHLLNWMSLPNETVWATGSFPKTPNAHYYLATDAVGKHLLTLLQNAPEKVTALQNALLTEASFQAYISQHPAIEEDDYTMIHIHNA